MAKGSLPASVATSRPNGFTTNTSYVLGPGGEQVTEYAVSGGTSTWQHTNVFAGGQALATYTRHRHLLRTWPTGWAPSARKSAQRTAAPPPSPACPSATAYRLALRLRLRRRHRTPLHRQRTGYRIGNDYFGPGTTQRNGPVHVARDPKMASGHAVDPQSWNRYSYSLNNPLKFLDPDGKEAILFYRGPTQLGDYGHVFIYVRNASTGRAGVFDFYPETGGKSAIHRTVSNARRDQHAGVVIPTTDAQADRMLNKMDALTKANIPFTADKAGITNILTGNVNDCVTTTEMILGAGGMKNSSITPTGLWDDASTGMEDDPLTDGSETGVVHSQSPGTPGKILGNGDQPPPDLNQFGLEKTQAIKTGRGSRMQRLGIDLVDA